MNINDATAVLSAVSTIRRHGFSDLDLAEATARTVRDAYDAERRRKDEERLDTPVVIPGTYALPPSTFATPEQQDLVGTPFPPLSRRKRYTVVVRRFEQLYGWDIGRRKPAELKPMTRRSLRPEGAGTYGSGPQTWSEWISPGGLNVRIKPSDILSITEEEQQP